MSMDDVGITYMNKTVTRNLWGNEGLGLVRKEVLSPEVANSVERRQVLNHHEPSFLLVHYLCWFCCCPCRICGHQKRDTNTNIGLTTEPEAVYLNTSISTTTSGHPSQNNLKCTGLSTETYHSIFGNDSKQRSKFFLFFRFELCQKFFFPRN